MGITLVINRNEPYESAKILAKREILDSIDQLGYLNPEMSGLLDAIKEELISYRVALEHIVLSQCHGLDHAEIAYRALEGKNTKFGHTHALDCAFCTK